MSLLIPTNGDVAFLPPDFLLTYSGTLVADDPITIMASPALFLGF